MMVTIVVQYGNGRASPPARQGLNVSHAGYEVREGPAVTGYAVEAAALRDPDVRLALR